MKKSSIILFILFIVSGIWYYQLTVEKEEVLTGQITRVIDGDTLEIDDSYKVRLKGINTPEASMLGFNEASEFLGVFENQTVEIVSFGKDKYDRILGYIIYDNQNLNEEILRFGLASLYYYEQDKYYNSMLKAEKSAKDNELGIWKKSSNYGCLEITEFSYTEPEYLQIENTCIIELEVIIKDDATHIYKENLSPGLFEMNTSHIWNNEGDSIYIWDEEGLLIFHRY